MFCLLSAFERTIASFAIRGGFRACKLVHVAKKEEYKVGGESPLQKICLLPNLHGTTFGNNFPLHFLVQLWDSTRRPHLLFSYEIPLIRKPRKLSHLQYRETHSLRKITGI